MKCLPPVLLNSCGTLGRLLHLFGSQCLVICVMSTRRVGKAVTNTVIPKSKRRVVPEKGEGWDLRGRARGFVD